MALSSQTLELVAEAEALLLEGHKFDFDRVIGVEPDFMEFDGSFREGYDFDRLCPVALIAFSGLCFDTSSDGDLSTDSGSGYAVLYIDEVVGNEAVAIDIKGQRILYSPAGGSQSDVTDGPEEFLGLFAKGMQAVKLGF